MGLAAGGWGLDAKPFGRAVLGGEGWRKGRVRAVGAGERGPGRGWQQGLGAFYILQHFG